MNDDHWPVYDEATAEPKYGYNPFAWSAEAADDWPVPYTLTPAAEALLEAEAGAWTAPWEWQGRSADTAEIHLTEEAERQSDAEAWGGRGPSASYAEWLAEGQPEAGA
jgi:hypothetical protein